MFETWPLDLNQTLGLALWLVCGALFIKTMFDADSTIGRKRRGHDQHN